MTWNGTIGTTEHKTKQPRLQYDANNEEIKDTLSIIGNTHGMQIDQLETEKRRMERVFNWMVE